MSVVLHSRDNCVQCAASKRLLKKLSITYTEVDLDKDEEALERVKTWGFQAAPVIDADGDRWSGYNPDKIRGLVE